VTTDNDQFYYKGFKTEGCKRLTIPLDDPGHLDNSLEVLSFLVQEIERISKQRIPAYMRLFHARMIVSQANADLKARANGHLKDSDHYKGAR
tara:strand:+ start:2230 stop:2505 length:276 start_codon:yes stop_codon:yes gene_type:complete